MDFELVKKGFDYTQKRRKWVLLLGALGLTGFGAFRVYQLPSVVEKRKKLLKLFGALISIAEAASYSAETIGVVSKDLKEFVQSDSDQIPKSLRQVSKITRSEEFSKSVITVTKALTVGILRGYRSQPRKDDEINSNSSFSDKVLDKLFSTAGSGFASVVTGSFARNLVMAWYSNEQSSEALDADNLTRLNHVELESTSAPKWVNAVCDEKCRGLIGDCIQLFVSTAVAVYLDKTMHINTYDEIFSGLTNPKHEREMKDMLSAICNVAIETLVKTSNQVLTSSNVNPGSSYSCLAIDNFESQTNGDEENGEEPPSATEPEVRNSSAEEHSGGWMNKMSSSLAVPSNRKLVLDVTGKVTFEMVRSFLELLMEKIRDGLRTTLNAVHEEVIDNGVAAVGYMNAKSSAIVTICISLCLHILGGVWVLVPA